MKRRLQIIVAESRAACPLREMIDPRRRVRHAATEQECIDLGHAGAGDVMLVDIDDPQFRDPDFVSRLRFVSRSAFPILAVTAHPEQRAERWIRCGAADVIGRSALTPWLLDRTLRHWVKHQRLQVRVHDANRRALHWWKDLVSALDEVRARLVRSGDAFEAFLRLLESGNAGDGAFRRSTIAQARKQVTEITDLAAELDVAARTIQLQGIEHSRTQRRSREAPVFTESCLSDTASEAEARYQLEPRVARETPPQRRTGTAD